MGVTDQCDALAVGESLVTAANSSLFVNATYVVEMLFSNQPSAYNTLTTYEAIAYSICNAMQSLYPSAYCKAYPSSYSN